MSDELPEWPLDQCPECGATDIYDDGDFYHCEVCGTRWPNSDTTLDTSDTSSPQEAG